MASCVPAASSDYFRGMGLTPWCSQGPVYMPPTSQHIYTLPVSMFKQRLAVCLSSDPRTQDSMEKSTVSAKEAF